MQELVKKINADAHSKQTKHFMQQKHVLLCQIVQRGGSVVSLVPYVHKVAGSNPTLATT